MCIFLHFQTQNSYKKTKHIIIPNKNYKKDCLIYKTLPKAIQENPIDRKTMAISILDVLDVVLNGS